MIERKGEQKIFNTLGLNINLVRLLIIGNMLINALQKPRWNEKSRNLAQLEKAPKFDTSMYERIHVCNTAFFLRETPLKFKRFIVHNTYLFHLISKYFKNIRTWHYIFSFHKCWSWSRSFGARLILFMCLLD